MRVSETLSPPVCNLYDLTYNISLFQMRWDGKDQRILVSPPLKRMLKGPPHSLLSDMGTQNAGEKLKPQKITLSLYTAVLLKHLSISEKNTFYQNMDGMVGKILSVFRILPFWPTLQQINLKKNNTKKYGYIRAWVWRQFVPAGIVLTNVQGRQAILTKCHPDNMSS